MRSWGWPRREYKLVSGVNSPDELKYAIRTINTEEHKDQRTVAKGHPGHLIPPPIDNRRSCDCRDDGADGRPRRVGSRLMRVATATERPAAG